MLACAAAGVLLQQRAVSAHTCQHASRVGQAQEHARVSRRQVLSRTRGTRGRQPRQSRAGARMHARGSGG
jgi:hypothetical protein